MMCPNCYREVGQLKKNQYIYCKCGVQLMCIQINKKLELVNLGESKEERK